MNNYLKNNNFQFLSNPGQLVLEDCQAWDVFYFNEWSIFIHVYVGGDLNFKFVKNNKTEHWAELDPRTGKIENNTKRHPSFVKKFL